LIHFYKSLTVSDDEDKCLIQGTAVVMVVEGGAVVVMGEVELVHGRWEVKAAPGTR